MIFIEKVQVPVTAGKFLPAQDLEDVADFYPQFIKEGGTLSFHGFLIAVIKEVQAIEGYPAEICKRHYSEHLAAFMRHVGMIKFREIADKYTPLRPKKKKGGKS